jgi:hypothetical protein
MFKTPTEFSMYIEEQSLVRKLSIVDTILEYCQDNFIEPKEITHLINKPLKDKIERNYQELGMLPEAPTLDSYL